MKIQSRIFLSCLTAAFLSSTVVAAPIKRGSGGTFDEISSERGALYQELNSLKSKNDSSEKEKPLKKGEVDDSVPYPPSVDPLIDKNNMPQNTTEVIDKLEGADKAPDDQTIAELDGKEAEQAKIKIKNYDIDYVPAFFAYSFKTPSVKLFKKWLKKNKINKTAFKMFLGSAANPKAIVMSALYYDWVRQNPSVAENFYRLMFRNRKKLSLIDRLYLADYLMRTGRGNKIHYLIKHTECASSFKYGTPCFYYLGMDKYIATGKPRNRYFDIIRTESKKVRRIMAGKAP